MKPAQAGNAFEQLVLELTPRYGAGEARSMARILFEDVFASRKPAEKVFSADEETQFLELRRRLLLGEPLQYVLGQADFFGLKFLVNPAVLIPRQETEELVAWVLNWLKETGRQAPAVLDIGLGSGCIAIALKAKRPDMQIFGLEKSPPALEVALENARRLLGNENFTFYCGDILDRNTWSRFGPLDVIVSNPPYIPRNEQTLVPAHVLAHEPAQALFVEDADPLIFYRVIGEFALQKLNPGGALFFECNEFNATAAADLLRGLGFSNVELRKDIAGADRMLTGQKSR